MNDRETFTGTLTGTFTDKVCHEGHRKGDFHTAPPLLWGRVKVSLCIKRCSCSVSTILERILPR